VPSPQELQSQADEILWYHTIDLGEGVVTKGMGVQPTGSEILPDVAGRSVLDIGAWDGKFSFLAEKGGAASVTALDHYAWGVDIGARTVYWQECQANGTLPDHSRDVTDFWRPELPGQRGFNFAKAALGSKVKTVVDDFAIMDLEPLGHFDVTLYLGVLYHMKEPVTCLERVRSVTNEVAVIETEALQICGLDELSLLQFHVADTLRTDYGNWYVPTLPALRDLCLAAGFSSVKTINGPPPAPVVPPEGRRVQLGRRVGAIPPASPPIALQPYRAIVHAYV
jgi:tRNA (mo5U34)-methyltransferase